MSKKTKYTYFKDAWQSMPEFSAWLCRAPVNTQARCKLCKVNFELSNMGLRALVSHANSKGHKKLSDEQMKVANFFRETSSKKSEESNQSISQKSSTKTSSTEASSNESAIPVTGSQSTIPECFQDGGRLAAEIRWALKHVVAGYSDNAVENETDIFRVMFPDSKIAASMELGKTKLKYIVNHGLAPYFKDLLKERVLKSQWFSVSFDESLNKSIQECEMDLIIRFWDNISSDVQVRYWGSEFSGHATATDILKNFNESISGLDVSKQVQISMDGPSVNTKFLGEIKKERDESGISKLIDIGSCNLHIVHGALKTGTEKTGWNLKGILKGAFQLLKDSPARREDYVSITGSTIFPLQFCATR